LGELNKSPWENYLEGGGSEEIIKSTRFCKVHYVLNSDIKEVCSGIFWWCQPAEHQHFPAGERVQQSVLGMGRRG
jgi:hypothetical protein